MATNRILSENLRTNFVNRIKDFLEKEDEEVLVTGSNEISIPCVDSEGNERWIQIVVKVPIGCRDGEPFDGYSLAEDYEMKKKAKEEKAKEAARKKAEKIKKDQESREAKRIAREKKGITVMC